MKALNRETERRLIEKAKNGDMSAFRELVEQFQKRIFLLSLDFTGNREDAEDVLQDVLMKAYKAISSFRGDSSLKTWLHRVTVNTCLDRRRVSTRVSYSFDDTEPGDREREAAQILDRSEGTIKNVLFRSLKKLQKELSFYREELGIGEAK